MNAFLTGSRAYGTPREDSDVDLVVLVSDSDMDALNRLATDDDGEETYGDSTSASLRFGNLNLICMTDPASFGAWKEATAELIARKPVTRDKAVQVIQGKLADIKEAHYESMGEAMMAEAIEFPEFEEF